MQGQSSDVLNDLCRKIFFEEVDNQEQGEAAYEEFLNCNVQTQILRNKKLNTISFIAYFIAHVYVNNNPNPADVIRGYKEKFKAAYGRKHYYRLKDNFFQAYRTLKRAPGEIKSYGSQSGG